MTPITDVSIAVPSLSEIVSVLTLTSGYNSATVVVGTTLLGLAAGLIGTFALLRKRALMGDALAHSALPGLCIAFIVGAYLGVGGKHLSLLLVGAAISGIAGVISVQLITKYSRLHEDTAIGAVLSTFFGAGVLLISIIQSMGTGEEGGLHHFIYGQTAAMNRSDAYLIGGAAVLGIVACVALFKELRLVGFDRAFALSQGWSVIKVDLVLMSLVVLVVIIGLQAVGLLLVVALLIIPPASARFWTENLTEMALISALIGAVSGYLGSAASSLLPRLPAGAVIVLVSGVIFAISFMIAPARGLLARVISQFKLSLRISQDHILREYLEQLEVAKEIGPVPIPLSSLKVSKSWGTIHKFVILAVMQFRSLVSFKFTRNTTLFLTADGMKEAAQRLRNHRLWEEYVATYAHLSLNHVDYSADFVEHFLSGDVVKTLEEAVQQRQGNAEGKLKSLHELSVESG